MRIFFIIVLSVFAFCATQVAAQNIQKLDSDIVSLMDQVSEDNINQMLQELAAFETRHSLSDTLSETRGIGAARRYIYNKFQEFNKENSGRLKIYFDEFDQQLNGRDKEAIGMDKLHLVNVVAVLPGKSDDVRYIINGHYDTRTDTRWDAVGTNWGADDDGSGTVVTMELARVLSKREFDHTLIFVAFVAEEQGLWGSTHMAEMALKENWSIGGVVTNDCVGNIWGQNGFTNNTAIRVFSKGPDPDNDDSESRNFARYMQYIGEPYMRDLRINQVFRLDRFGRGGDHRPFHERGFPAIRFVEMNESFERQHGIEVDHIDYISFEYMAKLAKLQTAALYNVAMAPRAVKVIYQSRRREDATTELRWVHPTKESDIAGYKVFIRKTDQGYWQEVMDIGPVEMEISERDGQAFFRTNISGRSVDDYIFGVVAYDKSGFESPAATYSRPKRN